MDFVDDVLQVESLLSDFEDDSDDEGHDVGCCLCLLVCPWKPKFVSAQLEGSLKLLRKKPNVSRYGAQPFQNPNVTEITKPHYVNLPEFPMPPIGINADADGFIDHSQHDMHDQGDTRVLDKYYIRIRPKEAANKFWKPSGQRVRVDINAWKWCWTMWKDKRNFYCVFGVKRRQKMYYVAWCNEKIRLVKGTDPVGRSYTKNDQRFFKFVNGLGNYSARLQHVGTAKYVAIDKKNFLVLVTLPGQAQSWKFDWV